MGRFRYAAFLGMAAGVVGCLALLLWPGAPKASSDASGDRLSWQQKYRRDTKIPYPDDNPYSKSKSQLGEKLFFDTMLSGAQTLSCASCHKPGLSWTNNLPRAVGETKVVLDWRVPTILNVAWIPKLGWDGHFRDLESVAFGPITSPNNMNLRESALIARLTASESYGKAFTKAFGEGDITRRKVELALSTYQRTIVSTKAPFDRWIEGEETAISAAAKRGFDLFNGKAQCASCHSGWAFTDASFHDIGTAQGDDIGRGKLFPNSTKLRYAFKTPTLRDVARRAPYMHNGSHSTLESVIDLYDRGGVDRPSRSERIFRLGLADTEKADLISFLGTLTGEREIATAAPAH
jgi:cytochrome c peroxidase